ncbi:TlpA family protein disulfide reductase [Pseudorhodoferax sp.]|uniref:TlpA family protein disulfide reductase n=1 Tax=Pseudorhodoferax sp. TaxID=1993553 RepID=UPI002DD68834|nr:TlpA disulfide reductase family protein [Pseudorhodoferax sp.]
MIRRSNLVLFGAGVAAAAAGAGWAWWRLRVAEGGEAPDGFWSLRFPRPEGGELDFASLRGRVVVLNFWATWCPPCVKEMPDLDRVHKAHAGRGVKVVGLAVDGPTPVRQFLQRQPVSFEIGLAGFDGTELSRALGNSAGGLPFTVVFGRDGRPRFRKLGQTHVDELNQWLSQL